MGAVIKTLIQDCVAAALSVPRSPLFDEHRDLALSAVNDHGHVIWLKWPWDAAKIDEFSVTSDANKVITMPSTVGAVRAVRQTPTDGTVGARVWNEDELNAAADGVIVSSGSFQYMAPDSSDNVRLLVNDASQAYTVLALKRWVNYTAANYDTETWPLDEAEPALRSYVRGALRRYKFGIQGGAARGDQLVELAVDRLENQQDRDHSLTPRSPLFEEVGNWY